MSNPHVKGLSQKILQGWSMLADSCSSCNVPLVKSRDGAQITCVGCKTNFDNQLQPLPASPKPGTPKAATPKAATPKAAPPPFPSPRKIEPEQPIPDVVEQHEEAPVYKRKSDNVSAAMGQYLLKGWTMLSDVCPNPDCNVPLMRERGSKRMLCVSCEQWVVREEDLQELAALGGIQQQSSAPVPVAAAPVRAEQPKASPVQQSDAQPVQVSQATTDESQAVRLALGTLAHTLVTSQQQLRAADDLEEKRTLVAAIHECSEAMLSLRKLL
eukprot:TRINITY_DN8350_c0_g1_i1.p1 TRINITY_DN8350_c0_g1~~TRINITY_DN8350_c0_g1_i1.p1  ORF type:complete len:286 (-),score=65.24 TRINITY_DN8350_c0_g1_i1:49-858(-)